MKNVTNFLCSYAEKISKAVDEIRKRWMTVSSVWVLACPLTSHFDVKKPKLGQKKTPTQVWEKTLEKDKWKKLILRLNQKTVKFELISQACITCKRDLLNLCAALAKVLSPTLASIFVLTEKFTFSFNYNSCQGRSWFLKRKSWSFAV